MADTASRGAKNTSAPLAFRIIRNSSGQESPMRCARPGPFFVGIFHIWKLRSCSFTPLFLLHCLPGFLRPGPGNESPVLVPRFKLFDDADFRLGGEEGGAAHGTSLPHRDRVKTPCVTLRNRQSFEIATRSRLTASREVSDALTGAGTGRRLEVQRACRRAAVGGTLRASRDADRRVCVSTARRVEWQPY